LLELNRFVNLASYNKGGAESVDNDCEFAAQNCEDDERREESHLFWLAWTAQTGTSVFSTGDASGPFRRAGAFVSCSTLNTIVQEESPLFPIAFGLGPLQEATCDPAGASTKGRPKAGKGATAPEAGAAPESGAPQGQGGAPAGAAQAPGPLPGGVGAKAGESDQGSGGSSNENGKANR
jgi:hypothetical protein